MLTIRISEEDWERLLMHALCGIGSRPFRNYEWVAERKWLMNINIQAVSKELQEREA